MANLGVYFRQRVSKPLTWDLDCAGRNGLPHRRVYHITPRGAANDEMFATVESVDFDRGGAKLTRVPVERGRVRVDLKGLPDPMAVLEEAARLADPEAFAGRARAAHATGPGEATDRMIAALSEAANLGKDEIPPVAESVSRFARFRDGLPTLLQPDLFSSATGILRARWRHGQETLFIHFPAKEPLGWTVSFPREGSSGMVQLRGVCIQEADMPAVAARLGVRCTR